MILITSKEELPQFVEKNNWLLTEKSDKDNLKIGDDYLRYLTPEGQIVFVLALGKW